MKEVYYLPLTPIAVACTCNLSSSHSSANFYIAVLESRCAVWLSSCNGGARAIKAAHALRVFPSRAAALEKNTSAGDKLCLKRENRLEITAKMTMRTTTTTPQRGLYITNEVSSCFAKKQNSRTDGMRRYKIVYGVCRGHFWFPLWVYFWFWLWCWFWFWRVALRNWLLISAGSLKASPGQTSETVARHLRPLFRKAGKPETRNQKPGNRRAPAKSRANKSGSECPAARLPGIIAKQKPHLRQVRFPAPEREYPN